MSVWEISLFVLLVVVLGIAIAMLILSYQRYKRRDRDPDASSSSAYPNGWRGRPLPPSFAFAFNNTNVQTGLTGTLALTSLSTISTSNTLVLTGSNEIVVKKHGAGRYRASFSASVETGTTGGVAIALFVNNVLIAPSVVSVPTTGLPTIVSGETLLVLDPGSTVQLRSLNGTISQAVSPQNGLLTSLLLERLGPIGDLCSE